MKKGMKVFLITCAIVFLVGLAATVTGLALSDWKDWGSLSQDCSLQVDGNKWVDGTLNPDADVKTETLSGKDADFDSIDLDVQLCAVTIEEGKEFQVTYAWMEDTTEPEVGVHDGTLEISGNGLLRGEEDGPPMVVEITVPEGTQLDWAQLKVDMGLLTVEDIQVEKLDLELDKGALDWEDGLFEDASLNLRMCDSQLLLPGNGDDYQYSVRSSFASIQIEGETVRKAAKENTGDRHLSIDAKLCNVEIEYEKNQ